MENPNDATIRDILSSFGLADQKIVPVMGSVVDDQANENDSEGIIVQRVQVLMAAKQNAGATSADYSATGFSCELSLDQLTIGSLHLSGLEFQFSYHSATLSSEDEEERKAHTSFSISSVFDDSSLYAALDYDSDSALISASLRPVKDVFVRDALAKFVPESISNALDSVIGGLKFKSANMALRTDSNFSIDSLHLLLVDDSQIQLNHLGLTNISVNYVAARPAVPATSTSPAQEATPSVLELAGRLQKGNEFAANIAISCVTHDPYLPDIVTFQLTPVKMNSLSVTGLISLFDFSGPTVGVPVASQKDYFDMSITVVSGTVQKVVDPATSTSSLKLKTFETSIVSTNTLDLYTEPVVQLDQIRLTVEYNVANTLASINCFVHARLIVGTSQLWLQYVRDSATATETFSGQLDTVALPLQLTDIGQAIKMPQTEYSNPPSVPNLPTDLSFAGVGAVFVKGKSLMIWALGKAEWSDSREGVAIKTASLGGLMKISRTASPSDPTSRGNNIYEAYITGDVDIAGFTSPSDAILAKELALRGLLCIVPAQPAILTAQLTAKSHGPTQLDALTAQISPENFLAVANAAGYQRNSVRRRWTISHCRLYVITAFQIHHRRKDQRDWKCDIHDQVDH